MKVSIMGGKSRFRGGGGENALIRDVSGAEIQADWYRPPSLFVFHNAICSTFRSAVGYTRAQIYISRPRRKFIDNDDSTLQRPRCHK